MSKNISNNKKLLVISDTGMSKEGEYYSAFAPVVNELYYLLEIFEEITWIGFLKELESPNRSYSRVTNSKIKIIPLKAVGGNSLRDKIKIIANYPEMILTISKQMKSHSFIHTRLPSNPGIIAVLLSSWFYNKKYWHKFAGNWNGYLSFFYRLQKYVVREVRGSAVVTVNGNWSNQPKRIRAFENPCITEEDRLEGYEIQNKAKNLEIIRYCFVGNLNNHKGVDLIIKTFKRIKNNRIGSIDFIGSGSNLDYYKKLANDISFPVKFHGFQSREAINEIYKKNHFIILASKSEGFPKVIGEAMNFGCIPIVSDISCIGQYVKDGLNGFLLPHPNESELYKAIQLSLNIKEESYKAMSKYNYLLSRKFTYNNFIHRLKTEVFQLNET